MLFEPGSIGSTSLAFLSPTSASITSSSVSQSSRLLDHGAERRLFDAVLEATLARQLVKARGRQRTDSTHVLTAVHAMTRIEGVTETLRHALNELASVAPEWLLEHTTAEWADRYSLRASDYRLPKGKAK